MPPLPAPMQKPGVAQAPLFPCCFFESLPRRMGFSPAYKKVGNSQEPSGSFFMGDYSKYSTSL